MQESPQRPAAVNFGLANELQAHGVGIELLAGPQCGLPGDFVEVVRDALHDRAIVVAQQTELELVFMNELQALHWIGAVADHVAEKKHALDPAGFNVLMDGLEGFEVGVYVGKNGNHRWSASSLVETRPAR